VTTSKPLRPEPGASRPRIDDQLRTGDAGRSSFRLAVLALVLSVAGIGLAAWSAFAPAGADCQSKTWAATPASKDLPAEWTIASSQYDIARKTMSLLGPTPADETVSPAVVYVTITCYPEGAADAVTRSADAATTAGQVVTKRDDLGDQGFSALDDTGATFLQFRRDRIVVYLAASGDATAGEVDQLASAFDKSMGGDGGAVAIGTPDAGSVKPSGSASAATPEPSLDASPSAAAAPELEAVLPAKVGDVVLVVDSATGSMFLGEDQGSRAIAAALRADGHQPDDLAVAQAYDETAESDLSILALGVKGMTRDKVMKIVLDSWLAASGAGVTRNVVTLAGRSFTRVDYGDGGPLDYVVAKGDIVIVITSANPDLAALAAAALP
jgi:hypothetical protein